MKIKNNIFRDTRTIDLNDPGYLWYMFQSGILMSDPLFNLTISNNLFQNVQYGISFYADVDGPINITNKGTTNFGARKLMKKTTVPIKMNPAISLKRTL